MSNKLITPKKVYPRSEITSLCRLCKNPAPSKRLVRIFTKTGLEKDLQRRIVKCCGIVVEEQDVLPKSICRQCDLFISRIWEFRQQCNVNQVELRRTVSVKRLSSSPLKPRENNRESEHTKTNSKKKLLFKKLPSIEKENIESLQNLISTKTDSVYSRDYDSIVTLPITENSKETLHRAIDTCQPLAIAREMHKIGGIQLAIKRLLLTDLENSCKNLCKENNGSTLFDKSYQAIAEYNTEKIWSEICFCHPYLIDIFNAVTGRKTVCKEATNDLMLPYCLMYSIMMKIRWRKLSLMQRVNSVLFIEGGCSKQLQTRMNKMGVCLSSSNRYILLNLMGGHFMDKAVEKLKIGKTLRGTGDNWDIRILAGHMRKLKGNVDLHLFASNIIENRVDFSHLSNDVPKCPIEDLPRSAFSLNVQEWKKYVATSKVLIGRILLKFFPKFGFLKHCIPNHIEHQYNVQMKQASNIISMPIINANENNYADCVKILRTYESWIAEMYNEAGLLEEIPAVENPPLPDIPTATAGQRLAHTIFTENDEMKEMKIAFAGDQLTRVRFAGAKHLMGGHHTPADRFEHCSPFKPVMWHTKASILQYCYHLLYKPESVLEVGTIKFFREKYNRKNVTPTKVLDSYEGCEELFISLGTAYIINAALKFFGMTNLDDKPTNHKFPKDLMHKTQEEKTQYFDKVLLEFVETYVIQKNIDCAIDDYVCNYGLSCIYFTILLLQMKDTAKEADGGRNLINQKLCLNVFKSLGAYSKYALEMFIAIAQVESLLTPRLAEEFKWSYFVSWRGGSGNNIEDDCAQEISNKIGKSIVQGMGPNKSLESISRVCKAVSGIKETITNFDKVAGIHRNSSKHTTTESETDEIKMIKDLQKLKPFESRPRAHPSFPSIKRFPARYMNVTEFNNWLKTHVNEIKTLI